MKVVVLGAGRMGRGLALCYAMGDHEVTLVDTDAHALASARAGIREAAALLVEHRLATNRGLRRALNQIEYADDLTGACGSADLVQESIQEDLEAKQELFARVEPLAPWDAILGSNTSSLRISAVGARMRSPERLMGLHWVAPPYLVPIVEVVRTASTPDNLVQRARTLLEALGKIPVVVPDVPGFALNRLQYAFHAAAVDLVDHGIVGPREVDLLVRYAMAPRLLAFGLLEQFDLIVSGRTVLAVANYLFEETGDSRFQPSPRLAQMVDAGHLGLISGAGWFEYSGEQSKIERQRDEAFADAYRALADLDRRKGPTVRGEASLLDSPAQE
jgi:3-hydroxybutyryl-CoA dehydrogenase